MPTLRSLTRPLKINQCYWSMLRNLNDRSAKESSLLIYKRREPVKTWRICWPRLATTRLFWCNIFGGLESGRIECAPNPLVRPYRAIKQVKAIAGRALARSTDVRSEGSGESYILYWPLKNFIGPIRKKPLTFRLTVF